MSKKRTVVTKASLLAVLLIAVWLTACWPVFGQSAPEPPGRQERPAVPAGLPARGQQRSGLILLAHGWRSSPAAWSRAMANDIITDLRARGVQNDWDVVALDWSQRADTESPNQARVNAANDGAALGETVARLGYEKIHVIGHSAGAWLVDRLVRVQRLRSITSQTTFLDPYVPPAARRAAPLGELATYAENYFDNREGYLGTETYTDAVLPQAYNVDVTKTEIPPSRSFPDWHAWPYRWYGRTVQEPIWALAHGWGYGRTIERNNLPRHGDFPRGRLETLDGDPFPRRTYYIEALAAVEFSRDPARTTTFGGVTTTGPSVTLRTASPAWIVLNVSIDEPTNYLSFTWEFLSSLPSGDGWLTVYLDRDQNGEFQEDYDLLFEVGQRNAYATGELGTQIEGIPLDQTLEPGDYYLAFRLDTLSPGIPSAIRISDVEFGYTYSSAD